MCYKISSLFVLMKRFGRINFHVFHVVVYKDIKLRVIQKSANSTRDLNLMKLCSRTRGRSRKISILVRSLISGLAMNSNSRVVPTLQHQCRSTTIDLSARTRIRNAFSGLVNLIRRVRWIGKFLHRFTRGQKRIIGVINREDLLKLISRRRELSKH